MAVFIDLESDTDDHYSPLVAPYERRLPLRHAQNPLPREQVTAQVLKADETGKHANNVLGAVLTCYPYAMVTAFCHQPPTNHPILVSLFPSLPAST